MAFNITIHTHHKNESAPKFVPLDKPLMSVMDAFAIVKEKYKDAFEYLEDK